MTCHGCSAQYPPALSGCGENTAESETTAREKADVVLELTWRARGEKYGRDPRIHGVPSQAPGLLLAGQVWEPFLRRICQGARDSCAVPARGGEAAVLVPVRTQAGRR